MGVGRAKRLGEERVRAFDPEVAGSGGSVEQNVWERRGLEHLIQK